MVAQISYQAGIPRLAPWAESWLQGLMVQAGVGAVVITETARTPDRQALIMYNQCESRGVTAQRKLYGPSGNKVIDVYETNKALGVPKDALVTMMSLAIQSLGPSRISKHIPSGNGHEVLDIAPSSIPESQRARFWGVLEAAQRRGEIGELIGPPKDLAFHVEAIPPDRRAVQAVANLMTDMSTEGESARPGGGGGGLVLLLLVAGVWWMSRKR